MIVSILMLLGSAAIAGLIIRMLKQQANAAVLAARLEVHQEYGRLMLGESDVNTLKEKVLEAQEKAVRELMDYVE